MAEAKSSNTPRARVVLVHGLWMNAAALLVLQMRLRHCGFDAVRFGYPTVRAGLEESAARLSELLKSQQADEIHLAAHSMGGLVTLRSLELYPDMRVRRIVLMGAPVAGSLSGRRLASFNAGKLLLGANLDLWGERHSVPVPDEVDIGVIAGTLPVGLGWIVGPLPKPHDGAVSVTETKLEGAADTIHLRVSHSAMLFSAEVGRQTCYFFKHARFAHPATD
ncbi:MAG: alpha/beta fold hydrolase [Betaproteobacteria bacterium]|nr:MAG: alpha/beta fold hydrolase [Betaproteobacteria bacterium]